MRARQWLVVVLLVLVLLFGAPTASSVRSGGGLRLVARPAASRPREPVQSARRRHGCIRQPAPRAPRRRLARKV